MPELPEVEAVARTLRPLVRGQTIVQSRVLHPIVVRPQRTAALRRRVEGQRIENVERRGKYLLLQLTRGWLVLHLRLDGKLLWFPRGLSTVLKKASFFVAAGLPRQKRITSAQVSWSCARCRPALAVAAAL